MPKVLDSLSVMTCPHSGQVKPITTNTKVKSEGTKFLLRITDSFAILGCPFMIPSTPPVPSPCIIVQWSNPAQKVKVIGIPVLLETSIGLCLNPAGMSQGPVTIMSTQKTTKAL